ncbi:seed biotin-containing protein SBP65-like [Hibiscus syriacus]|uniref:seed biotin-containing protein SBP65-like n=1 Tax=Hibiscus syriacus TaxID=106335 RepID=UPI001924F491|nr:seed biotin-containing protein SBP65-like [Hibiscus syriacus]
MASDQLSRRENTTSEREVHLEENQVPKMATHFESLAEKSKQSDAGVARQVPHRECHELGGKVGDINVSTTIVAETEGDDVGTGRGKHGEERAREPNYAIGKFEVSGGPGKQIRGASMESQGFKHEKIGGNRQERGASMESMGKRESDKETRHSMETAGELRNIDKEEGGEKREQLSLEEISKLRGTAQQNSMETLRAAEERYNKAKESAAQALNTAAVYTKDKGQQARETARQSAQYAAEKGGQATDTVRRAAQKAAEMGGQTKDTIVEGAKKTSQYIAEKGTETKDTAAETLSSSGRTTADYSVPKMEQAGKVAVDVKDRAVVAGWTTAHYTTEKAVEGTKVAARMVEGAAEYAGQKSKELAATSLRAAKDAASAAGETIIEYTARKKEEAARDFEAKRSTEETTDEYISYQEEEESRERPSEIRRQVQDFPRKTKEKIEETAKPIGDALKQTFQGSSETNKSGGFTQETERRRHDQREKGPMQTEGVERAKHSATERNFEGSARRGDETESGVLGAIAETIVEIAQNTTDLVNIGPDVDFDEDDNQPKTQRGSGGTISTEHGADATTFRRGNRNEYNT